MLSFVVRRAVLGVMVLAGLSLASFCALASEDITLRDRPLLPQYWGWLKGIFTGQTLKVFTQPVVSPVNPYSKSTMLDAIGHTAIFLSFAFLLVFVFGAALALVAAARRGSVVDVVLRALSYLAWGVPAFLLAMLVQRLIFEFGDINGLGPFKLSGWPGQCPGAFGLDMGGLKCAPHGSGIGYVGNVLRYVTLPSITLALAFIGFHGRYLRSTLLETLDAPFIVTARAKGLRERRVVLRHAMRASLPVFLSAVLSDAGAILGTSLAIDWIFSLGGLGTVFISEFPNPLSDSPAINTFPLQMLVVLAGSFVLFASFLAELAVIRLDPRIRDSQ
jgi:peptide/nickel transport system permease protein